MEIFEKLHFLFFFTIDTNKNLRESDDGIALPSDEAVAGAAAISFVGVFLLIAPLILKIPIKKEYPPRIAIATGHIFRGASNKNKTHKDCVFLAIGSEVKILHSS